MPAPRFVALTPIITAERPNAGIRYQPAASAPTNAPAVLKAYTSAWKRVASSRFFESACVSMGIVPPIRIVGGSTSAAQSRTSIAKPRPGLKCGSANETRCTPAKSHGKRNAYTPMPASTAP